MNNKTIFSFIASLGLVLGGCSNGSSEVSSSGKAWKGAQLVETTTDGAAHPRAVLDDNGNIIATWRHQEELGANDIYRVFASLYNGTSWSASMLVSNATSDTWDDAYDSHLSFDAQSGNIMAVWR